MLKESLELLASDVHTQMRYLTAPEHGVPAGVDELAENFGEDAVLVRQLEDGGFISPTAAKRIHEVDEMLDSMSGESKASLWTPKALETSETWSKIREAAKAALRELSS